MDVGTEVWVKVPGKGVWAAGEVLDCQYAPSSSSGVVQVRRLDTGDVVTRRYSARESSEAELCLRNQTRDFVSMSSLTGLEHLHEPALLQALSERFAADHIYTSIGDILVAMNPLKALPLYSQQHIDRYKRAMYGSSAKDSRRLRRTRSQEAVAAASDALDGGEECPPHVFAIGGKAFSGLLKRERCNQSILVSGESGSGKTESTKFLMQFLTSVGRDHSVSEHGAGDVVEIGKRILQTNPILESFGNAQTIRNDNSSRFGKFIKIQFGEHNQIVGAEIVSYLLEKVRLIHQSPEERSFHIFYELLEGSDPAFLESLGLKRGAKYELLNTYGPHFSRRGGLGAKYAQLYTQTVRAFEDTGVEEQERLEIFKILAALLHLGNVNFVAASGSDEDGTTVTPASRVHLDKCAELMGVDVVKLEALLVSREIKAGVEVMVLKLNPEQAKDISRSLAKAIYGRLFTWLVRRLSDEINYFDSADSDSVRDDSDGDVATIGILDIFGFESLNRNGFEQLCINYANERLQAQFNEFVFVREQQVYIAEGIDWRAISYPSNEACLALFDDKSNGLFSLLDQECLMPKGSNQALSTKFYRYHGGTDGATDAGLLQQPQGALPLLMTSFSRYLHRTESEEEAARKDPKKHPFSASKMERVKHQFVVHHFAGRVCYNVEQFVEKNTDSLPADASSILSSSSNDVVVAVGGDANMDTPAVDSGVAGRRRYSMLRAPSVSAQFKSQLDQLVVQIGRTEAHYIRCLKPNEVKKPGVFDRERMVEQLRSVGVLEALRIARHGYSVRLAHSTFVELFSAFRCLLSKRDRATNMSTKELAQALVRALMDKMLQEDGVERENKNAGALAVVNGTESEENDAFERDPRRQDVQVGKTLVFCKSTAYNRFSRYRLELRDAAAVTIQRRYRGFHRRVLFQQLRAFVLRVQAIARGFLARTQVEKMRQARRETSAVKLQRACRRWLAAKKRAAELEQARQLSAATRLQRQARLWLAQTYLVDAKVQRFRLQTAFKRFRRACAAAQAEAEREPSPVLSDDSMAGCLKRRTSAAVAVARGSSGLDGTQSSSEVEDDSSLSDEKLERLPVRVASTARRRANSKARSRAGSRQRSRASSSHVDDRNSMLENEIVRLQQMLVDSQNGRTPPSSSRERRRTSSVSRPPRSAPLHLALEPTVRPPRVYSSRRSYSMDGAEFSEDETGEEGDEVSLLPPRRAQSVMPGQQLDHVSVLSQKIEELDAKCRFLEQLVARKNEEDAARESLMYGRDFGRDRFSSLDGSAYGSMYADAPPSEADSDVDSIIYNIQSQMHMLRQSIAAKQQAIQTSRKSHTMSFSSSTRPTRTSSAASTTSYSNLPGSGEAPPSLPSLTPSESQLSAGGSSFGNGPRSGGSSLGLPPTPTSVASASMASYYQGPPRSAPAHFGGRGMPRIVKWARATNCYECEEPFNLFVRRHHCRMCGNSFCHEHSSRRLSVFGIGFDDEPVRVCDNCFAEYYAASQDPFAQDQYPQHFGGFASGPLSSSSRLSAM